MKQMLRNKLIEHKLYVAEHGEDLPDIRDWKWTLPRPELARRVLRKPLRVDGARPRTVAARSQALS